MLPILKSGVLTALALVIPAGVAAQPAALLVGNENYEAFRDVRQADAFGDLEGRLADLGFASRTVTNANGQRLQSALVSFETAAAAGEGAVVMLSGRFVHSATETYFLATDSEADTLAEVRREALPLSTLTAMLAASSGRAVLALADGGAFEVPSPFLDGGVGEIALPQGVTLLQGPADEIRGIFGAVIDGETVLRPEALSGADVTVSGFVPWNGRLAFSDPLIVSAEPEPDPREAQIAYWEAVRGLDTVEGYENYLDRYPRGIYAAEAEERQVALRDAPRREAEAAEAALRLNRDQRREIQRALTILDFDTRGIDGIFGRGTRAAISAFQEEEGFEVTGYLTREQIRRLDRLARTRAEDLEEEARREAERAAREDREYWSVTGASGREADLRRYLDRFPDGIFAEEARADLRAIEEARRPEISAAEQLTWERVEENGSAEAYREYLRRYPNGAYADAALSEIERLEEAERGGIDRQAAARREDAMNLSATTRRTIEQRLAALEYNPGPVDGIFDDRTRNALLRYQRDRRLPATGYMNDATMVRILADTVISIFD